MNLEIELFGHLRKFNSELEQIEVDECITIRELFEKAGIPSSEVALVLVDGRNATLEQQIGDGETVAAFPPIAGG